jgi:hypothetical protein
MGCSGCAEIATNIAVQGGVQYAGEKVLIANNKPVTKCNVSNMVKGYKMCRIKRVYKVV